MEGANFDEMYSRLIEAVGSSKSKDIAKSLGISEQAVSQALKKKRIPSTWIYKISSTASLPVEWFLYGGGVAGIENPNKNAPTDDFFNLGIRCLELHEKLERANERLYEAMKENGALKEEVGKLKTELAELKNEQSPTVGNKPPMSSAG